MMRKKLELRFRKISSIRSFFRFLNREYQLDDAPFSSLYHPKKEKKLPHFFYESGTGEVIEPDDGILAIGSGGNYALAAGRALKRHSGEHLTAKEIAEAALTVAADICVYTNHNIIVEALEE
ncbi:ATP-dependent protease subunit HslV [Ureibacillus acetophenoni]